MPVASYNTRPRVTIHEDLRALVQRDADELGLSVSEIIAKIVQEQYEEKANYEPSSTPRWQLRLNKQSK